MFPAKRSFFAFLWLLVAVLILPSCSGLNSSNGNLPETAQLENPPPATEPNTSGNTNRDLKIKFLEEKIVLLESKVKTLENRMAGLKKVVYTIEYSDPAQLYTKARTLLLAKEVDDAADLFSTFVEKHPNHSLADNALYWLGECHYTRGRYQQAVQIFKGLIKNYPKAEKVPDTLLKTGYAYISLDDINRADHYLKLVIKKYPFSPAAEKAEIKLREFQ